MRSKRMSPDVSTPAVTSTWRSRSKNRRLLRRSATLCPKRLRPIAKAPIGTTSTRRRQGSMDHKSSAEPDDQLAHFIERLKTETVFLSLVENINDAICVLDANAIVR